jgi:DNA-binding NarL/FixJ family response regulator
VTTRILLVDDHRLVRKGFRTILESVPGFEVAGEGANGREALRLAEALRPDVALMDLSMPDMNGIETTHRMAAVSPQTRVVVLSMHSGKRFLEDAVQAGARGYLLKDASSEELVSAVRAVAGGGVWFAPQIVPDAADAPKGNGGGPPPQAGPALTPREREVMQLFSEGNGTKEVAWMLGISVKTVEAHRQNLMRKLGIHSIAELTRYAIREGLTPL